MHFQSIALNIVLPNTYVQNYLNKNSIISYFGLSLFPPLRLGAQSYTKFLQLKSTSENAQNLRLFSQPLQGARHTTLSYFYKS